MTSILKGVDVAIRGSAEVGEGPVIDPRTGRLIWVDLTEGVLLESDLLSGDRAETRVGRSLGAAVPRANQAGFAVAVAEGFGFVADGKFVLADEVLPSPLLRMNDAKCDARGRLWAGSTRLDFANSAGALHRWDGVTSSTRVVTGFTLPNGLGWNAGNTVIYLNDSVRHHTLKADFDLDAGTIGVFETCFTIEDGLPDGLSVDVDGGLWVAVWGSGEVRRFRPDGTLDTIVPVPVSQPSSCCFGADGVLYITSARVGVPDEELAGSVFAIQTHTVGVEIASFAA